MNNVIHKDLANGRWLDMNLSQQLGNIGSEVGRAANWQKKGKIEMMNAALNRALDLLNLTIADKRWRTGRKELCRAREVLVDTFWGNKEYNDTPENLEKYFFQFAVAAKK